MDVKTALRYVHSAGVDDFLREQKDLQQGITPSTNIGDVNVGEILQTVPVCHFAS